MAPEDRIEEYLRRCIWDSVRASIVRGTVVDVAVLVDALTRACAQACLQAVAHGGAQEAQVMYRVIVWVIHEILAYVNANSTHS